MPYRHQLTADLKRVYEKISRTPSANDYREHGNYTISAFYSEFESWVNAQEIAGVDGERENPRRISREAILQDIQQVNEIVEGVPTVAEYNQHGKHSETVLYHRFDSWPEAREKAGISGKPPAHNKLSRQTLIQELQRLADELNHTPRRQEMNDVGEHSGGAYRRKFGSWNEALTAAGFEPVHEHNIERDEFNCDFCGTTFEQLQSQVKNQKNRFCSRQCKWEWEAENKSGKAHPAYNRITTECSWCGDTIAMKPSVFEERKRAFCDYTCMGEWRSENKGGEDHPWWEGGMVELSCTYCEKTHSVKPVHQETRTNNFCSRECFYTWKRESGAVAGENNPNWEGGYFPYYGPNWPEQRRRTRERDDYRCQGCKMTDQKSIETFGAELSVHHRTPRREFADNGKLDYEQANCLENLVTLCRVCHKEWEVAN